MRLQSGVTLVEMMVAVAIIFIFAAIAIPTYQGYLSHSRDNLLRGTVENFGLFQTNFRFENGTFLAGEYEPGGDNDFAAMGYVVPQDTSGISLRVEAGACGDIARCYKVTATNEDGRRYIRDGANELWLAPGEEEP